MIRTIRRIQLIVPGTVALLLVLAVVVTAATVANPLPANLSASGSVAQA